MRSQTLIHMQELARARRPTIEGKARRALSSHALYSVPLNIYHVYLAVYVLFDAEMAKTTAELREPGDYPVFQQPGDAFADSNSMFPCPRSMVVPLPSSSPAV